MRFLILSLVDAEGIYNPLQHNDRLLLGLKGAMSEAELYTIKTRMLEGKRAKGVLAVSMLNRE